MDDILTCLSLFTGIGGIDLAAECAGFQTVGQCEIADYPTKVLEKHWPEVPRWRDIRDVTADSFRQKTGLQTVNLISGGFPCQPFSISGKRRGKTDDRFLWPEMLRVIKELKPRWVLGENVAGFISLGLDDALSDLETCGYESWSIVLPACSVGAPHRRDRVFILSYSGCTLLQRGIISSTNENEVKKRTTNIFKRPDCSPAINVANTDSEGQQAGGFQEPTRREVSCRYSTAFKRTHWAAEPSVGRVANGVPSRMDRLKCLGNAVVPQQVYPILKSIAEIENQLFSSYASLFLL